MEAYQAEYKKEMVETLQKAKAKMKVGDTIGGLCLLLQLVDDGPFEAPRDNDVHQELQVEMWDFRTKLTTDEDWKQQGWETKEEAVAAYIDNLIDYFEKGYPTDPT